MARVTEVLAAVDVYRFRETEGREIPILKGISFVLSAALATPGCEMRAIPHLWTIVTGRATKEHYCPGFLDGLDKWELGRSGQLESQ